MAAFLSIISYTVLRNILSSEKNQRKVARGLVCRAQDTLPAKESGQCGTFPFLPQGAEAELTE